MKSVKLLIKYKADVNVEDNVRNASFSLAFFCHFQPYAGNLLILIINQEGWTPLHLAIQSRSREIAKVLLVNGADATRRNKVKCFNFFVKISIYDQL